MALDEPLDEIAAKRVIRNIIECGTVRWNRLLRLLVLHRQPAPSYDLAEMKHIGRRDATDLRTRLVPTDTGWAAEAA